MADPPGSHIQNHSAFQAALGGHLAALQQQQQQQQQNQQQQYQSAMRQSNFGFPSNGAGSGGGGGGGGTSNDALANFLAQQQQQPQQQQQHTQQPMANWGNSINEHQLLRALQRQQGGSFANPCANREDPPQSAASAGNTPGSNPLGNALNSMLMASSNADLAMNARNRIDEMSVYQALTSNGFQQQQQQPDALAQFFQNPSGLADSLQTLRMRANLLGGLGGGGTATLANYGARPSEVASLQVPAAQANTAPKKPEITEDEEIPLPDLPKERPLPPLEEGDTPHWSERVCVPLATDEDSNWLSERQCFIRAELLEVVRASHQDVLVRSSSKSVAYQQVGIRCRYCAHLHPSARSIRSSAYPSSIRQMYQSFTMMVRDHWSGCTALPPKLKERFMAYQEHKIPSSSLSREYWAYAAEKIGMINTEYGITITEESLEKAKSLPAFGTTPEHTKAMENEEREPEKLVHPSDEAAISPYLYHLMQQVEVCHLLESERVGKRKDAPVGLSGFGCTHCIRAGRLGFCRVFPLNKRSLPTKVNDLYTHFQRCPLTPAETRKKLRKLKHQLALKSPAGKSIKFAERDREFVDQIWTKLGRKGAQIGG